MKRINLWAILIFVSLALWRADGTAAIMEDYCQVPPNIMENIPPNIMIIMDNSGSMLSFSYTDSETDMCDNSSSPCTGFDPTKAYYGYFDSGRWYSYTSNKFKPEATKTAQPSIGAKEWDGNFLNWLTMRRVDVM
ncbi:MAG: hypothetical protein R3231_09145, partial [bacterium]|nr:hypothetical protein [bacterium]